MTAIGLACAWVLVAALLAMRESARNHWPEAWGLIAAGLPILAAVFWTAGLWPGLLALAAGLSVLRWPLLRLCRWLRRLAG